jgi:hypothetical protein
MTLAHLVTQLNCLFPPFLFIGTFFYLPFGKNLHKNKMLGGDVLNGHNRNHV